MAVMPLIAVIAKTTAEAAKDPRADRRGAAAQDRQTQKNVFRFHVDHPSGGRGQPVHD
jgi:hypothetical protein